MTATRRVMIKRWRGGTSSDLGFTATGAKIEIGKRRKVEPAYDWELAQHPYIEGRFELVAYER